MLERVLVCLLAGGHLLIEGVPGLAKTLTIKTTAQVLGGTFGRVQFTPDLVPSDLVGTRIYRAATGDFATEPGPVFCNFLLADEINRAPAKVQSALLEVMQERQVTIGGETFPVPSPFLVMATQNPIEQEGTYPLPEAQIDRFMLKVVVGYPSYDEELTVAERSLSAAIAVRQVISLEELAGLQAATARVYVDPEVMRYAVELASATRDLAAAGLERVRPYVAYGASPRGPISLVARRPRPRARARPPVRAPHRRARARAGRPAAPRRAELPGAGRGGHDRPGARARDRGRPRAAARARPRGGCVTGLAALTRRAHTCASGPGSLPEPALRALDLAVRRRVSGLLAGEFRSIDLGAGTELAQIRPYRPGDDVRLIDWSATARTGEPHVRVDVAERPLTTLARARHLGLDAVRHRRPPQGGRRRGRGARARPRGQPPRQPPRPGDVRRPRPRLAPAPPGACRPARGAARAARPARRGRGRPDRPRPDAGAPRARAARPRAGRDRERHARPARLAPRADPARRPPRRARDRAARPARGRARGRGRPGPGRSRDRPALRVDTASARCASATPRPRWPSATRSPTRSSAPAPTTSC